MKKEQVYQVFFSLVIVLLVRNFQTFEDYLGFLNCSQTAHPLNLFTIDFDFAT